jgi:hypothetical protein
MVSGRSIRADGGSWTGGLRAAVEPAVSWHRCRPGENCRERLPQLAAFP